MNMQKMPLPAQSEDICTFKFSARANIKASMRQLNIFSYLDDNVAIGTLETTDILHTAVLYIPIE